MTTPNRLHASGGTTHRNPSRSLCPSSTDGPTSSPGGSPTERDFRRSGVLRVNSIADIFYMTEVLAKQPRPKGNRL